MMQVGKVNLQHSSLATKREKVVDEKDYMAKSSDLQRTFGGKKAVRKMEKADKFRLNAATNDLSLETTIAGKVHLPTYNIGYSSEDLQHYQLLLYYSIPKIILVTKFARPAPAQALGII